jgi:hypothetical protein
MNRLFRATSLVVASAALVGSSTNLRAADPTTGDCLTANDKAIAFRNEHKLLAARAQLLVCAATSCPGDIRKECVRRIDQINESIPTVVFEAKDGAGNDLTAVKVKMDGEVLTERLEGTAISLNPGAHAFTFEIDGQPAITKQLVIREGQKDRRETVQLGTAPTPSAHTPSILTISTPPPSLAAPAPGSDVPAASSSGSGTQKVLGIIGVGVGVAGIGVGTIFGLRAMSKHNQAADACPDKCADANGVKLWEDARSAGTLSTIGFTIGGVALAGGAILWLTAKPAGAPGVRAAIGPSSVALQGAW